ncbi:agmatine deiminase family protein [Halomonas litopenaei]|uniref:agmatine deiminase family protein n=1 Tax=Halomonas litopenaei TaxID=2109328 RepID=UPI003F9FCF00
MPRLLPEWHPQDAVQLTWPRRDSDWAPTLPAIEAMLEQLALIISRYQSVIIGVPDRATGEALSDRLVARGAAPGRLRLTVVDADDTWARDHGPLATGDGDDVTFHDLGFNGWGGKFPADRDNTLTRQLNDAGLIACPTSESAVIMEGGALETDGEGTLLTTEACLLNPNRNPSMSRADIEAWLAETLGIQRVLWLQHGHLEGDDTDSHIDTLARFCDPQTIAYVRCDDPSDAHYAELAAMERELKALTRADGSPYRLVPLPWPVACRDAEDGHRLPATYANFLIINGAVLVPVYGDRHDLAALNALAGAFPERDIIPVDASAAIVQHGSLHCLTMQWPQGALAAAATTAEGDRR